jgi:hypothetical protein
MAADSRFPTTGTPSASAPEARIVTPAGSTIEAEGPGGYLVCDAEHHCTHVDNLWQAQQLVQGLLPASQAAGEVSRPHRVLGAAVLVALPC